jgi:hypothetical protein
MLGTTNKKVFSNKQNFKNIDKIIDFLIAWQNRNKNVSHK